RRRLRGHFKGRTMKSVAERAATLGPLRSFDSDAFRPDAIVSEDLCYLVLGFALLYNDCRDVLMWHEDLMRQTPERKLNRVCGEYGGSITHTFRLLIGIVHELGELIQKRGRALNDPFFQMKVLPKLDKEQRARWEQIHDLAFQKKAQKAMDEL